MPDIKEKIVPIEANEQAGTVRVKINSNFEEMKNVLFDLKVNAEDMIKKIRLGGI